MKDKCEKHGAVVWLSVIVLFFIGAVVMLLLHGWLSEPTDGIGKTRSHFRQLFWALEVYGVYETKSDGFDASKIDTNRVIATGYYNRFLLGCCVDRDGLLSVQGNGVCVFVDGWGRPIRMLWPRSQSELKRGLASDLWDSRLMGDVQFWSVGPNGIDECGKGDDIVPHPSDIVIGNGPRQNR